jgi:hypothetical protein
MDPKSANPLSGPMLEEIRQRCRASGGADVRLQPRVGGGGAASSCCYKPPAVANMPQVLRRMTQGCG